MATVMTQSNSEGTRRCDATCHNAKRQKCTCICGGKNHGVGYDQAVQNVRDMFLTPEAQGELQARGILSRLSPQERMQV